MIRKKYLAIILAVFAIIGLFGCTESATNTETENNTSENTETTSTPDVFIPTDSSLADSVFENASDPTKPAGDESDTGNLEKPDDSADATDPSTDVTAPDTAPDEMTYEAFIALTPEEQRLYQESFDDLDAFFAWYNAAKEKYEKENPPIEITGPVDLGKY